MGERTNDQESKRTHTSLVTLDQDGHVALNITVRGHGHMEIAPPTVSADGAMALFTCVTSDSLSSSGRLSGHHVLYVVPKDGKDGWSLDPGTKCEPWLRPKS